MPMADIATPNRFELEWLTGLKVTDLASAKSAIAALQAMGPRCVMLTSFDLGEGGMSLLAAEGGHFWQVTTPLLPISVNGAGDAIAALFLLHRARSGEAAAALSAAASSIYGVLRQTSQAGSREILTVAAQEEFVAPSRVFAATRV